MPAAKVSTETIPKLHLRIENRHKRLQRHKMLCSREYKRLHAMVPAIATKVKVSKITVIEETIKYIDELHTALWLRLQTKGLPKALKGLINTEDAQHLSCNQLRELLQKSMPTRQQMNSNNYSANCIHQRNNQSRIMSSKKLRKRNSNNKFKI